MLLLMLQEQRCLQRCKKAGIRVPDVLFVDDKNSRIIMQLVPGCTARAFLNDASNAARAY